MQTKRNMRVKSSGVKPALTIQWEAGREAIFPGKKVLSVGVHGIEGCFTHEAFLRFLEEHDIPEKRIRLKFLVTAENVLNAATSGATDLGIFAIANSGSGAYVSSIMPIADHTFKMHAVFGMKIMQCLLAHKSVKSVEGVKEVFGHPQAVSQCKRTFSEKYPRLKVTAGKDSDDTALCAKRIADGTLPRTTATLASQIAAKRYGLNIISYNMHHDPFNTTTFLLVSKK